MRLNRQGTNCRCHVSSDISATAINRVVRSTARRYFVTFAQTKGISAKEESLFSWLMGIACFVLGIVRSRDILDGQFQRKDCALAEPVAGYP